MNKNFILITFFTGVLIISSGFSSMMTGIARHETWRVTLGGISMGLMVVAWAIIFGYYYREKKKRAFNIDPGN